MSGYFTDAVEKLLLCARTHGPGNFPGHDPANPPEFASWLASNMVRELAKLSVMEQLQVFSYAALAMLPLSSYEVEVKEQDS